jgi:hypothetical protein
LDASVPGRRVTIAVIIDAMKAVWIAIALAACGSPQPSPPPVPAAKPAPPPDAAVGASVDASVDASRGYAAEALARMSSFRDEMCECKDKACAERVTEALVRWGNEIAGDQHKISEQEIRQMAEITETMTKCMTTAMLGSAGHN